MLKVKKTEDFLKYLEEYVTKNIKLTEDRNLPENRIIKKFINILYCLCKQQRKLWFELVKNKFLTCMLRNIWNSEKLRFSHISQKTKEFTNLRVYKQLVYCLLEVLKQKLLPCFIFSEDIKLLYELMNAPIEHFPGSFQFLTSYLNNNENIEKLFTEMFIVFLDITKHKNIIPAKDLTKIPLTVSVQIDTGLPKLHKTNCSENLEIKIWRFILIPSFKRICNKKNICEVSKIHSMFIERLIDYKCDEVSEDLTICLVHFSYLLLKVTTPKE